MSGAFSYLWAILMENMNNQLMATCWYMWSIPHPCLDVLEGTTPSSSPMVVPVFSTVLGSILWKIKIIDKVRIRSRRGQEKSMNSWNINAQLASINYGCYNWLLVLGIRSAIKRLSSTSQATTNNARDGSFVFLASFLQYSTLTSSSKWHPEEKTCHGKRRNQAEFNIWKSISSSSLFIYTSS